MPSLPAELTLPSSIYSPALYSWLMKEFFDNLSLNKLVEALEHYFPLRLIRQKEIAPDLGREFSGGDGGESNSPPKHDISLNGYVFINSPQLLIDDLF